MSKSKAPVRGFLLNMIYPVLAFLKELGRIEEELFDNFKIS